jgi:hypothetical protein
VPVSPVGTAAGEFDLTCVGTSVYAAYAVPAGVEFVRSVDAGLTWAAPVRVGSGTCVEVRVVAQGSGVNVAWIEADVDAGAVLVNSSFDGGVSWKPTGDTVGVGDPQSLAVVREAGSVYVAWEDVGATSRVLVNRSLDGGTTWFLAPVRPKSEALGESDPRLAVLAGTVRLAYRSEAGTDVVRFTQSTDTGATWTPSIDVATATASETLELGQLAAGPSGVFLTWHRESGTGPGAVRDVAGAGSTNGDTWTTERHLDHNGSANGYARTGRRLGGVAITSPGCVVGFLEATDATGPTDQVRATILTATGITVVAAPDGRLQKNAVDESDAYGATICASGPTVYAFWTDNRDYVAPLQYDVWTTHSTDAGQTWAPDRRLSLPTAAGRKPLCCSDPTHVYVVWAEGARLWCQVGTRE